MKKESPKKSAKSFYEGVSWYHRVKILQEDGTTKYTKKGGFATSKEAEASYDACEVAYKEAYRIFTMKHQVNQDVMLKDYLVYWLEEEFAQRVETTTQMVAAYAIYDLILPQLTYDVKLKYVNAEYLNTVLKEVAKITRSAGNKGREILYMALKDAVVNGYLKRNPVVDTIPYKRKKTKVQILSKEKIKVLLKAASRTGWYLEILLALFCGLRKGEILGLKFNDFDFEKNTVTINRQLVSNPKMRKGSSHIEEYGLVERDPKTKNSFRTLRVPDVVMTEVRRRKAVITSNKIVYLDQYRDKDYVSCGPDGRPHSLSALNNGLSTICERNSLPHVTVHGLRHMYATILIEMNVPLVMISALLGHGSVHTTFEYYCEVMDENENILAFMNQAFVPLSA